MMALNSEVTFQKRWKLVFFARKLFQKLSHKFICQRFSFSDIAFFGAKTFARRGELPKAISQQQLLPKIPLTKNFINMAKTNFYAVFKGKNGVSGIYSTWDECQKLTKGVSGVQYKKFSTRAEAEDYLRERMGPSSITPRWISYTVYNLVFAFVHV